MKMLIELIKAVMNGQDVAIDYGSGMLYEFYLDDVKCSRQEAITLAWQLVRCAQCSPYCGNDLPRWEDRIVIFN